ncbi:deoxyribose-phosphate aldolase [Prolixibacteraceae bacterium JC049]|nr:deoxyribose-phosphate aldolase [Prolixibacteraceae bacterium JC049]
MSTEKNQPMIDEQFLAKELETVKKMAAEELNNATYKKLAFNCIDLTTLNSTDTRDRAKMFADNVNNLYNEYGEFGNVAAICVYPTMVKTVEETLQLPEVNIAAVAGGFPSSMTFKSIKVEEAKLAVEAGADEIDIVISIGEFLDGNYEFVHEEIAEIKKGIGEAHLKVILESGLLKTPENIWKASLISMNAGADFIKTSTGKESPAATLEAAVVMAHAIKYHYENTGEKIGFKPAGGITTPEEALQYIAAVKHVLGDDWLNPNMFRIGASRLANNLLTDLVGTEVKYF